MCTEEKLNFTVRKFSILSVGGEMQANDSRHDVSDIRSVKVMFKNIMVIIPPWNPPWNPVWTRLPTFGTPLEPTLESPL